MQEELIKLRDAGIKKPIRHESLNLGMGQSEIPTSQILSDDLVMTDPSILRQEGAEG